MRLRPRHLVAGYFLLLLASHLIRICNSPVTALGPGVQEISVRPLKGTELQNGAKRLVFEETPSETPSDGGSVLLLHGSPGTKHDFHQVRAALGNRFHLIVPDLPGFGASSREIPDFSIRSHAGYAFQLLDQLGVDKAHVVGFSMGGGVALEMAAQAPERIASISMISAIGVQELELLGDYHLNHLLHGLQLAALWLLREGVPHMGYLDSMVLGVPYARNFFDTDQRPLRGVLKNYSGPMLILHGRQDSLVPVAAALEHHRLVPQSELHLLDRNHFFVFREGDLIADTLSRFLTEVEAGSAQLRTDVPEPLQVQSRAPFDASGIPPLQGLALILAMLTLASATLISEDLTCISAGLMVALGRISFGPAALACFLGIYFGDLMLYGAGRYLGRPALKRRPLSWFLRTEDVERSSRWFARRGPAMILASRFLPGTRLATYFAAGLFKTRFWRFSFYFLLAAAIWTPALVALSAWAGAETQRYLEKFGRLAWLAVLAAAVVVLIFTRLIVPCFSFRGRRLLLSRFHRWRRWEYWPRWLFYPPVVAWVLWLGIKRRNLALFTAANPAMPHGGFIGESKSGILNGLKESQEFVAAHTFISFSMPPDQRIRHALRFMATKGLSYPVVLKPDQGERGFGVKILKTRKLLLEGLQELRSDHILQEYVSGKEFGVFYVRIPGQPRGHIFSITEKRLPQVVGDGVRTLEHLILSNDELLPMAPAYLRQQASDLDHILERGEVRQVIDLGTHSRGAIFLDGQKLHTPDLAAAFEGISARFKGFYFGRYDVRTSSLASFQKGSGFQILELNGVTSEATHIYDPATSLLQAYRVLFRQWELAFEVGETNAGRGAAITPVGKFALFLLMASPLATPFSRKKTE